MSKDSKNLPFSVYYKNKVKQKNDRISKALSRREKLLINYYKKYVLNKGTKKKKESNSPEKDCQ